MLEKIKKFWEGKPGKGKETMLVLILVGGLLAVLAIPVKKDEADAVQENNTLQAESTVYVREEYEAKLETRLEEILGQMEGVGKVRVMITLAASSKEVVEKDVSSGQSYSQGDNNYITDSDTDKEETTVYVDTENGSAPYVVQEIYPEIQGVLVVAEGGDNSYVNIAIVEAIQALFDVDAHKIKIVKMNTY